MTMLQETRGTAPSPARRCLDVGVAGIALLVLGIPLLLLMAAVRLTSKGPALFCQVRVGQGGRPFVMYKLRSMRTGTSGPDVTAATDNRITPLGAMLRRTSLDELPQLWNVLRGDMTLVGPRPETVGLASRYPDGCRWVFEHRPGLTGPTQVRMRDSLVLPPGTEVDIDTYLQVLVPARTEIDATFLQDPTLSATVTVLGETWRYLTGRRAAAVAS
jgi:lipopolysaccharide/colanic/teichoic acid biosynthesis glycosyltransferase